MFAAITLAKAGFLHEAKPQVMAFRMLYTEMNKTSKASPDLELVKQADAVEALLEQGV
jgi:hypothetical protein